MNIRNRQINKKIRRAFQAWRIALQEQRQEVMGWVCGKVDPSV